MSNNDQIQILMDEAAERVATNFSEATEKDVILVVGKYIVDSVRPKSIHRRNASIATTVGMLVGGGIYALAEKLIGR